MRAGLAVLVLAGRAWAAGPAMVPERDVRLVSVLGGTTWRHPGARSVLLSPDGKTVATTDRAETRLLDAATGGVRRTFDTRGLRSLHWTPGGMLAGVSRDGKEARLLNPATGNVGRMPLAKRPGPVAAVIDNVGVASFDPNRRAATDARTGASRRLRLPCFAVEDFYFRPVALAPGGGRIAYLDDRRSVRLAELSKPEDAVEVRRSASVRSLAFSSCGRYLLAVGSASGSWVHDIAAKRTTVLANLPALDSLAAAGRSVAALTCNGSVLLLDAASGQIMAGPDGHLTPLAGVGLLPAGNAVTAGAEGRILRWSPDGASAELDSLGQCCSLELSSDGRWLTAAAWREGVFVYSGAGFGTRRRFALPGEEVRSAGPVAPGWRLAVAGESGAMHDLDLAAKDLTRRSVAGGFRESSGYATAYSDSGRYAAASWGHSLDLFDLGSGTRRGIAGKPGQFVIRAAAFSPDDRWLALAREDGHVSLWDAATLKHAGDLDAGTGRPVSLAFSTNGRLLYGGQFGGRLIAWDVSTRKPWREWPAHEGWITRLGVRGSRLIAGHHDGTARIWEIEPPLRMKRPPTPAQVRGWWADLADADPRASRLAARKLAARPDIALPLIAPLLKADDPRLDKALLALERMGVPAARAVVARLAKAAPANVLLRMSLARMRP
ncbi:MAG: hypothetical protein K2W96_05145 [Gemmataceae bacterium]|nr:hypothetical protein [Gemmataceae bacterium]